MTWPQATIATGLLLNAAAIIAGYLRLRPMLPVLRGWQYRIVANLWLGVLIPVTEVYVLWCGGFWS